MMKFVNLILSLVVSVSFIGRSWAHLQGVPNTARDFAFAVFGGVNIGAALCCIIIYLAGRDDF